VTDNIKPIWRKSGRSGNGGNCVEVAVNLLPTTGHILVRNSKRPEQTPMEFTEAEWKAFIGGVHDGEFEL
jgi:hypothetical protein